MSKLTSNMSDKAKKYLTILALSISGGSIYLLPYIRYVFYDLQIEVMGVTNQQSGLLLTSYAIIVLFTYIPGGIIADKFSLKKCILYSLISTSVLSFVYAFTLNYTLALIIWGLFAFTTVFVFWQSLFKVIRMTAGDDEQGRMFGLYYAGNGITGAIGNALALWASNLSDVPRISFSNAVIVMGIMTVISSILVVIFLDDVKADKNESEKEEKFKMSDVKLLIKNPTVWIVSVVIFCGYTLFSSSSYFTPYLTNVIGISPTQSGIFTIIRTYIFMLLAPVGGYLVDKVFKSTSKWLMVSFTILGALYLCVLFIPSNASTTFVSIFTLLPGAVGMAMYGVLFSLIGEARIPMAVTATAVAIASIIGYTPDMFMHTMFGTWLDKYGNNGYNYIFYYLVAVGVLGLVSAYIVRRRVSRENNNTLETN